MKIALPDTICSYIGLMADTEIAAAIQAGMLLDPSTADLNHVRQTSYELRLSENIEFLLLGDHENGESEAKYVRNANGVGSQLEILPGTTVKVETMERFDIPTNVAAHITPVGNVYKLGLSPETTYADPGFDGAFFMILCNYSSRIVRLKIGQPIARIEFVRLAKSTSKPHGGYKTIKEPLLWPRRVPKRLLSDLQQVGVEGLLSELERGDPPHFEHAFIARQVRLEVSNQVGQLKQKLAEQQRVIACFKLVSYLAVAIAVRWIIFEGWAATPVHIQDKFVEGLAKESVPIIMLIVPLFFKSVRDQLRQIFLNRLPK
jgi:deoxycytidine triphosphate deaminase